MWFLLGVSLLISPNAWCEEPFWKSLFPASIENPKSDDYYTHDEFGHPDEPEEPMVYHWDKLYLENQSPEVIVDPYSTDSDSYWDYDEDDY